ncbi:hypothetical protein HDU81_007079 [Chytriomyces hyalinus]|nr:hypothetical protein HDU81_007079 [Chytriomyces hyalinus]
MIAPIARSLVARTRFTRAASSAPVGPWGELLLSTFQWRAESVSVWMIPLVSHKRPRALTRSIVTTPAAIPFGIRNRTVFLTVFTVLTAGLFSIPFVNLEMNVHETRKEAAKKQEELKEQMRGETSMKI